MRQFNVWAPYAGTVQLLADGNLTEMHTAGDGFFAGSADACSGTTYGFVLDGAPPLPDPRSGYQPQGVHGLSCIVDHSQFPWTDDGWQPPPPSTAIIYEVHTGTFTPEGTFDAAVRQLPYLRELGITHVQLMPVAAFPGQHGWGYDGVDLFAPHHGYGGPDGLKRFVNAAHREGLAVLLDVVYNHLGPAGNYLSRFGPYFTQRHKTPWGEAVNLDGPYSEPVRRFLFDNARMWLRDYHLDGLRLDAVHALLDNGATHFLEELGWEVDNLGIELGRHLMLIAESELNDPRIVHAREAGGFGLHAQWSDDFHHALHTVVTGERKGYYCDFGSIEDLARVWNHVFVYNGRYSRYRKRRHGREVGSIPGHKFLGYIQTHDQIGNRAAGERISHLAGLQRAKIAAGLVMTAPFIPMLFQGEEWAASTPFQYFTDHEDPELGEAISRGRRNEFVDFGWRPEDVPDPQDERTFLRSKLRWEERNDADHAEMLDWYSQLIAFRKAQPKLVSTSLRDSRVDFDEEAQWLSVERGPLTIVANFSREPICIPVREGSTTLLSSAEPVKANACGMGIAGESFAVLTTD